MCQADYEVLKTATRLAGVTNWVFVGAYEENGQSDAAGVGTYVISTPQLPQCSYVGEDLRGWL